MAAFEKVSMIYLECVGGPKDGEKICIEHYRNRVSFCVKVTPDSFCYGASPEYKNIIYEKKLHRNGKYYLVYIG